MRRIPAAFAYIPPAMRVEIKGEGDDNAAHTIQTVREEYAWNESGTRRWPHSGKRHGHPGHGGCQSTASATLDFAVWRREGRHCRGRQTTISAAPGSTGDQRFHLAVHLPVLPEFTATLDANNFITKVATTSLTTPLRPDLVLVKQSSSDYADHGEILTDVKSPGHIVEKVAGKPLLDVKTTKVDANDPYLVFPVPPNVKAARAQAGSSR